MDPHAPVLLHPSGWAHAQLPQQQHLGLDSCRYCWRRCAAASGKQTGCLSGSPHGSCQTHTPAAVVPQQRGCAAERLHPQLQVEARPADLLLQQPLLLLEPNLSLPLDALALQQTGCAGLATAQPHPKQAQQQQVQRPLPLRSEAQQQLALQQKGCRGEQG